MKFCVSLAFLTALLSLAVSASSFCKAATEDLNVTPRKGNWAASPSPSGKFGMERHAAYRERAKQGPIDVLFLGDSITQLWELSGRAAWQQHYAPLRAANFGIGGENTMNILWRITTGGELDDVHPKVLVLMAGTNNMGMNSAEDVADALRVIVHTIRRKLPRTKILLLGILPKLEEQPGPKRAKIKQVNKIIARMDDGKRVRFLDFGHRFVAPDGTLRRDLMNDLVHPTAQGYAVWAEAMQPLLQKMLQETKDSGRAQP